MKGERYVLSIWIFWFYSTALYLFLLFSKSMTALDISPLFGLFVPFGLFNFSASVYGGPDVQIQHGWIFTFPLTIGVFVLADFIANKWKMPVWLRVAYNLLILLGVTAAVDFVLWHKWKSWVW